MPSARRWRALGPTVKRAAIANALLLKNYCEASGGGAEEIDEVIVGTIDQTSGYDTGYEDYTATESTDMTRGTGYPCTVINGCGGCGADSVIVWADWNQDGVFDMNEAFIANTDDDGATFTVSITSPAGARTGSTRMRIRLWDGDYDLGDPCGDTSYGGGRGLHS